MKMQHIYDAIEQIQAASVTPDQINAFLLAHETSEITQKTKLESILKRPQIHFSEIRSILPIPLELNETEAEEVGNRIRYEQYIARQNQQNSRMAELERIRLPLNTDYSAIRGLSSEAAEKLDRHKPEQLAQAASISGVSPADISILITWLKAGGYHGE